MATALIAWRLGGRSGRELRCEGQFASDLTHWCASEPETIFCYDVGKEEKQAEYALRSNQ